MLKIALTWPNRITYCRMMLVPVFVIAALEVRYHPWYKYIAVGLFAVIAIGDAIDGYIAHRFNMSTAEGKFIDPLADKLLMITACVCLALPLWGLPNGEPPLPPEIAIIIVARDFFICAWVMIMFMVTGKAVVEPSRLGRVTTFVQMLMLATMLLGTLVPWVLAWIALPLSYVAAALTIISGLHYIFRNTRRTAAVKVPNEAGAAEAPPARVRK
jgi:CDP-diacylglycerol--glycerol-3-phosphate 3-phosphatidyltransferase